ncbi:PREDICTED: atypical chemokine receptor 2 isoform X1 [Dipodomys ordii]|uniref:Atypical chemokine receptor 2 n=2 Tax=Dipodomys ordii TaxID=10020 RepID=A0A1S3GA86_DIPOR|nr:PREDICTED: atypical chemokine receptor 2 isoform X1 [Dipodomys ordii]
MGCLWRIPILGKRGGLYLLKMASTTSPLPGTPNNVTSVNHSFYDYDYLEGIEFLLCHKEDVQSFARIFLPLVYSMIFVLGLIGNFLLLVVLLRYVPGPRRRAEIYLLNLAVSNLCFVVTLPFWAISVAWHWIFGNWLCKLVSALYTTNFYSGIFFISCMSLDTYLEIVHRQPCSRPRTPGQGLLFAAAVWAVALALSIPDLIFVQIHEDPPHGWNCYADFGGHATPWKLVLRFLQNLLGFLLPFSIMSFFYVRIGCAVIRLKPRGGGRAVRLTVGLVVVFFVLWFPYNLTLFLHSLLDLQVFGSCAVSTHLDYALQVTESLAFCHCCGTPLLYAFCSPRFRQYLKVLLATVLRESPTSGDSVHTSPSTCSVSSRHTAPEDMITLDDLEKSQAGNLP